MTIHPSAIIDPHARIGTNVSIGPFTVIGPEVEIGDDCQISSHVVIEYTKLGKSCQVYPQASVGLPPQHLKYKGEKTKVVVGDRCVFREGVTVHRGTFLDKSVTTVGNDCYFMALSHIAHDCRIGDNVIMANAAQLAGHVQVGNNVFISTTVGIHQFVRIGTGAMISGGAMVPLDVAPFCMVQGDRASVQGLNVVGMRRMGINRGDISHIKAAFKTVFNSGLLLNVALEDPTLTLDNPTVKTFRSFFMEPKRGFLRPKGRVAPLVEFEAE
ncbi:MAG: Acyl-[acyl-carrier-protein]--UDP-N-acetylglucosamine O-acyltransferase [Elusimicrobia bacterium]|nr:Acyl-[acyl-carrier-protein]--UDP-N-acetylglucosamine O-acyltransferase [Elusimicrobiota bacterium]